MLVESAALGMSMMLPVGNPSTFSGSLTGHEPGTLSADGITLRWQFLAIQ